MTVIASALPLGPALAGSGNPQFAGAASRTRAITIGAAGVLDVDANGTVLSSRGGLGTAATASIVSTGIDCNIDVTDSTPFLTAPADGNTNVTFATRYELSGDTSVLDATAGTRTRLLAGTTTLSVDLTAGVYTAQTTVTCG